MNIAEKRDYISSHLQFIEEDVVNTFFQKIHSLINEKNIKLLVLIQMEVRYLPNNFFSN